MGQNRGEKLNVTKSKYLDPSMMNRTSVSKNRRP